jgi:NAD+ kinase
MQGAKTVGIISKPDMGAGAEIVPQLLKWLHRRGLATRMDQETAQYVNARRAGESFERDAVPEGCDFILVLGGDGTLLSAAKAIGGRPIPMLAVNLGSLGFLTAITVDELYPELERALAGESRIGNRRMIDCTHERAGKRIGRYLCLNEAVVGKSAPARMVTIDAHVDENLVCQYKADGVIVATPTGSTAYSLSAGGPIIFPTVGAFAITPICPHMLTNRPVIVPDTTEVRLVYQSEDDSAFLNVDGQQCAPLMQGDEIRCKRSAHPLKLIRPPRLLYFDVLRQKLHWGQR